MPSFPSEMQLARKLVITFLACTFVCATALVQAAPESGQLSVDFSKSIGTFRALHGINKGPLVGGAMLSVLDEQRVIGVPSTRLHDCHWPVPDVVDIHTIFPDFNADPENPSSYQFAATDEYIDAVRKTGAQIVYRLGESIEHTTNKRFVHPPKDLQKWAAICIGIIRHYNEGWANGFHHDIRHWEIWNEPENRPTMWSGSDEDYYKLYETAARAIKKRFPNIKVGGPSAGYYGKFVDKDFQLSPFISTFLDRCRKGNIPLDFFSWHCYTADTGDLTARAHAMRRILNQYGFTNAESHLNEWNYLPANSWSPISKKATAEARQKHYEQMSGLPGASFIAAALLELQDTPVDVCNLFHGETGAFGIFNEFGVPTKNYYAIKAFNELIKSKARVAAQGGIPGKIAIGAGASPGEGQVLISNFREARSEWRLALSNLPWSGPTQIEIRLVDSGHILTSASQQTNSGQNVQLDLKLPENSIALISLRPAGKM